MAVMVGMEETLKTYRAFKARDNAPNAAEFAKTHSDIVTYCFFVEDMRDNQ